MTGRRALTGLSLLCALVFCAIGASSAAAATSGTTAVTCVAGATNDYGDAHCDGTKSLGGFGHRALAANPTPEVESASTIGPKLITTAGGLETEIVCTSDKATFTVENSLVGEVHKITAKGFPITYSGCTVPKPVGQECKVKGSTDAEVGMITTNKLNAESAEAPMGLKFTPAAGTAFVTLTFSGCKTAGLNKNYEVTGTVTTEPSGTDNPNSAGATIVVNVTKASAQLKVAGQNAQLEGNDTIKMEGGSPIATTATPFTVN